MRHFLILYSLNKNLFSILMQLEYADNIPRLLRRLMCAPQPGTSSAMIEDLYSDRYNRLRTYLRSLREDRDLTQTELAELIGRTQSYVTHVETGRRRVEFYGFVDWCQALDVDPIDAMLDLIPELRRGKEPE